jgi:hypothetical protein
MLTTIKKRASELVPGDELRLGKAWHRVVAVARQANGFVLVTLAGYRISLRPDREVETI